MTAMHLPVSTGSYEQFVHTVQDIKTLDAADERELIAQYQNNGDEEAGRKVIMSNLRFVVYIANSYNGYGFHTSELVQEGCVGLLKAFDRFDLSHGVRFSTFAVHWIKAEIHEYVLKNFKIMKVATTKAQRKLFFNLKKSKDRLGWFNSQEVKDLAEKLNVKPHEVLEMETRMTVYDEAFDGMDDNDDDDFIASPSDYLTEGDVGNPATIVANNETSEMNINSMLQAIEDLDPRMKDIVVSRWLSDDKATLKELAEKYGVSLERIRQLETKAFKYIKADMPYWTANYPLV